MDIESLYTVDAHEAGYEVNIINPADNKPTDIFIRVMGPDSKAWRRAQKHDLAKLIEERGKDKNLTSERLEEQLMDDDIDKMLKVTIGWRGIERAGTTLEFSSDECRKLYQNSPIVMDQMQAAIYNYQNFTKG